MLAKKNRFFPHFFLFWVSNPIQSTINLAKLESRVFKIAKFRKIFFSSVFFTFTFFDFIN